MSTEYTEPSTEAPQSGGEAPAVFATTTRTKDYLGRTLLNIATAATDYLGRGCQAGDKDYAAVALVA